MTFMTHPQHGANNVSPSDVATQEKAGWKVTDRAEWMASKGKQPPDPVEEPSDTVPPEALPPAAEKKKPGRKPKAR